MSSVSDPSFIPVWKLRVRAWRLINVAGRSGRVAHERPNLHNTLLFTRIWAESRLPVVADVVGANVAFALYGAVALESAITAVGGAMLNEGRYSKLHECAGNESENAENDSRDSEMTWKHSGKEKAELVEHDSLATQSLVPLSCSHVVWVAHTSAADQTAGDPADPSDQSGSRVISGLASEALTAGPTLTRGA